MNVFLQFTVGYMAPLCTFLPFIRSVAALLSLEDFIYPIKRDCTNSFVIRIHWHGAVKKFSISIIRTFTRSGCIKIHFVLFPHKIRKIIIIIIICCLPGWWFLSFSLIEIQQNRNARSVHRPVSHQWQPKMRCECKERAYVRLKSWIHISTNPVCFELK